MPGIVYGHGSKNAPVWVETLPFSKIFREAGQSSILSLKVDDQTLNVLVHDVQKNPLSGRFSHIDFFQVKMNEALETHVSLEFIGEAPTVREQGGVLVKTIEEVLVSCLPKDLPHSLEVDITKLAAFEDRIKVSDLDLPAGVTILTDPDTTVALVEPPRTDAEMAALDEAVDTDVSKVGDAEVAPAEEAPAEEAAA